MLEFYSKVSHLLRNRNRFALITVMATSGSTPRKPGAKMILTEGGEQFFSIGGGAFEAMVLDDARGALADGETRIGEYRFKERGEGAVGMACGGRASVLIEILRGPDLLMVFGGGHVGQALIGKASSLDLEIWVVEDRPDFLDPERFPPGTRLINAGPGFEGRFPPPDRDTYVCVLTRCHRTDLCVLRRLVNEEAAYIGVIGSRRKGLRILAQLRSEGISENFLKLIRIPIGLDLGGRSPAEIAISILAEIVQVRNRIAPREKRIRKISPAQDRFTPKEGGTARSPRAS